jgi:hypothetical protein
MAKRCACQLRLLLASDIGDFVLPSVPMLELLGL